MSSARLASGFENVYGAALPEVRSASLSVKHPEFGCLRLWASSGPELDLGTWQVLGSECSGEDSFRTLEVEIAAARSGA